jgi:hypothetical protein
LFLAVEVDGLIWPKGEARTQDTAWTCEVREEGTPPDGRFGLSLYLVSDRGAESIAAWLEHGRLTDDYPGLYRIDGSSRLDNLFLRLE